MANRASRRIRRHAGGGAGNTLLTAVLVSILVHALAITAVFLVKGKPERPRVVEIYNVTVAELPGPKGGGGTSPEAVKPEMRKEKPLEEKVRVEKKQVEKKAPAAKKKEPETPEVKKEPPKAPVGPGQGPVGGGGSKQGPLMAGPSVAGGVEFPYGWYLTAIQKKVENNWQPPAAWGGQKPIATIMFYIDRQGRVKDAKIEKGSGVELYDQKALIAVKSAAPLPPLPAGFRGDMLGVHYTFFAEK